MRDNLLVAGDFTSSVVFGYDGFTGAKSSVGSRKPINQEAYSRFIEKSAFLYHLSKKVTAMLKFLSKLFSKSKPTTGFPPLSTPPPAASDNKFGPANTNKEDQHKALDQFVLLRRTQASVQFLLVDGENNSSGFTPSHSDVLYMLDGIAENLAQLEKVVGGAK